MECLEYLGPLFKQGQDEFICGYYSNTLKTLQNLLICRRAYWEIAGKQMGLGKPWEPDWNDQNINKYCLATHCNMIVRHTNQVNSRVFSFPTSDMRDAFYENFKDLIEQCKELL